MKEGQQAISNENERIDRVVEKMLGSHVQAHTPILDLFLLLAARKRLLMFATVLAMVCGGTLAFLMKPVFTATATIMPPQAPQSSLSSLMGQLGSFASLGGGASSLLKNPSDIYVGLLQSRTISMQAIGKYQLDRRWHTRTQVSALKALEAHTQFEAGKDGLIHITVKEHDPRLASDLANFFVDGLYHMNSSLAISEASQRRLFFEQQLSEEKTALANAEDDLKATQQKTGLLSLNGQTELAVRNIAQTRAQISAREVQLRGLRTYAAEDNPDVARIQEELGTLRAQLNALESSQKRSFPGDTEISTSQVPTGGLEYARKLREVKYHDTLLDLLSRQYEAARLDEAKSAPIIQVIDRSVPPDQKSGPPRLLIALGSALFGFFTACAYILLSASFLHSKRNEAFAAKWDELQRQLLWRNT